MIKLLIISPFLPWPLNSGGNVAQFYMLKYLSKKFDITYLTSSDRKHSKDEILQLKNQLPKVNIVIYKLKNNKYNFLRIISKKIEDRSFFCKKASKWDINSLSEITPDFLEYVDYLLKKHQFRIVQIEFYPFLPIVFTLPTNVQKLFVHHELRFVVNELNLSNDVCSRFIKNYKKTYEVASLNKFDRIVALSDIDKQKMIAAGVTAKIIVSPLIISDKKYPFINHIFRKKLTFVGGAGHFPNLDGLLWFVKNVKPYLDKNNIDIELHVIGAWDKNSQKSILQISSNVIFKGFVPDLLEELKNSIMIVPIRVGSGIRMKILEAASMSIPFVSTTVGVEGLDFINGKECLIADTPESFAEKLAYVIKNPDIYSNLSAACYKKFNENYSPDILSEIRSDIYNIEEL